MKNIDRDRVFELYISGLSAAKIRNIFRCDYYRIKRIIDSFDGIEHLKGVRRKDIPVKEVLELYSNGNSELFIASKFKTARNVIRRILTDNSVTIRNGHEANLARFSNYTDIQKINITKSANKAMRNKPKSFHHESAIKQAISKELTKSKVGSFENSFIEEFTKKGFNPVSQKAVDVYNIDIAIGNIAVEIHVNTSNPHSHPFYRRRIEYLTNLGWNVIYIKITQKGLNTACIDKICRIVNFHSTNPSLIGKYWMFRGTGEFVTIGEFDIDKNSLVLTSENPFNF
jgi:hypothetical protein